MRLAVVLLGLLCFCACERPSEPREDVTWSRGRSCPYGMTGPWNVKCGAGWMCAACKEDRADARVRMIVAALSGGKADTLSVVLAAMEAAR